MCVRIHVAQCISELWRLKDNRWCHFQEFDESWDRVSYWSDLGRIPRLQVPEVSCLCFPSPVSFSMHCYIQHLHRFQVKGSDPKAWKASTLSSDSMQCTDKKELKEEITKNNPQNIGESNKDNRKESGEKNEKKGIGFYKETGKISEQLLLCACVSPMALHSYHPHPLELWGERCRSGLETCNKCSACANVMHFMACFFLYTCPWKPNQRGIWYLAFVWSSVWKSCLQLSWQLSVLLVWCSATFHRDIDQRLFFPIRLELEFQNNNHIGKIFPSLDIKAHSLAMIYHALDICWLVLSDRIILSLPLYTVIFRMLCGM